MSPRNPTKPCTASERLPIAKTSGRPNTQVTASAGKNPTSVGVQYTPQAEYVVCWECNLPGHIRRNCPMRNRPTGNQHPFSNTATENAILTIADVCLVPDNMILESDHRNTVVENGCSTITLGNCKENNRSGSGNFHLTW